MKAVRPYIINHIQLDQQPEQGMIHKLHQQNYYLVFWWKDLPLGDLYVHHNEALNEDLWYSRIINSIAPALDAYIPQKEEANILKSLLLQQQHVAFTESLNNIFKTLLAFHPPAIADISVIICTRNRTEDLKKCLDSLSRQTLQPKEIIIVDNAPDDNSTYQLTLKNKKIIYCKEQRAGLSKARNAGIIKATSEIIAFVDDDVELHPSWAYRVWQTFEKTNIDAMTGLVIAAELKTQSQQLFEKYWSFNRGYQNKIYNSAYFKNALASGPKVWDIGAGANMAFRKKVFDEAGYFDERLGAGASGCSEDSEYWFRLLAKGFTIQYNPLAVVYHTHRKDLHALNRQIYCYMRGFTTAALIQQSQLEEAGYRKIILTKLPKRFFLRFAKQVKQKRQYNVTLIAEVKGLISGLKYYHNNKNKPSFTQPAPNDF